MTNANQKTSQLIRQSEQSKARIYLLATDELLQVCLGGTNNEELIDIPMDPMDEDLWVYYIARRQPDFVSTTGDPATTGTWIRWRRNASTGSGFRAGWGECWEQR